MSQNDGLMLVDMSNLVMSTVLGFNGQTGEPITLNMIRTLVLKRLQILKNRYLREYPNIVLCFDARTYWRRDVFPPYKASRKIQRDKDEKIDWEQFFRDYDAFKKELFENFPVVCLEVDGAEADDIIAILSKVMGPHRPCCVVSSDKDMIQIQEHICPTVKIWSLSKGKFVTPKTSDYSILEHVIRGDPDDGVPNIRSDDEVLITEGVRQKSISKNLVEEAKRHGITRPEKFCPTHESLKNFHRNQQLIDFRFIPDELTERVVQAFNDYEPVRGRTFNYIMSHGLATSLDGGKF